MVECSLALWDGNSARAGAARRYLAGRGLQEDILKEYWIGYNPRDREIAGLWVPRGIVIPNFCGSRNIMFGLNVRRPKEDVLASKSKYVFVAGGKRAPFGIDDILDKRAVFVLEGEFDTMLVQQALWSMGTRAAGVGAFTMGSAGDRDIYPWIVSHLAYRERFLLSFDIDAPGQDAASFWQGQTKKARLYKPPESYCKREACKLGHKDISDYWQHAGGGALWEWLEQGLKQHP
jgi:DNA primase